MNDSRMFSLSNFFHLVVLCGACLCASALADAGLQGQRPPDISWVQRRASPDVFYAGIYSDPAKPGPYAFRVRAQAGHRLAPHTHPDERTVTVLSGTYWSGVGETFAEDSLRAFPAGSFYVIPAGLPHFSAVLEGEVEFQEAGVGPSAHDPMKPAGGTK
jgi:hypothetical protein